LLYETGLYLSPAFAYACSLCAIKTRDKVRTSENTIEIVYSAYDIKPTVTAEAIDIAVKHCEKHGKGFKYVSGNALNVMTSTKEIHTFLCTNDHVDECIEVKVK